MNSLGTRSIYDDVIGRKVNKVKQKMKKKQKNKMISKKHKHWRFIWWLWEVVSKLCVYMRPEGTEVTVCKDCAHCSYLCIKPLKVPYSRYCIGMRYTPQTGNLVNGIPAIPILICCTV